MKKLFFILSLSFLFLIPTRAHAADNCDQGNVTFDFNQNTKILTATLQESSLKDNNQYTLTCNSTGLNNSDKGWINWVGNLNLNAFEGDCGPKTWDAIGTSNEFGRVVFEIPLDNISPRFYNSDRNQAVNFNVTNSQGESVCKFDKDIPAKTANDMLAASGNTPAPAFYEPVVKSVDKLSCPNDNVQNVRFNSFNNSLEFEFSDDQLANREDHQLELTHLEGKNTYWNTQTLNSNSDTSVTFSTPLSSIDEGVYFDEEGSNFRVNLRVRDTTPIPTQAPFNYLYEHYYDQCDVIITIPSDVIEAMKNAASQQPPQEISCQPDATACEAAGCTCQQIGSGLIPGDAVCRDSTNQPCTATSTTITGGLATEPEFCDGSTEQNPIIKTAIGCIPANVAELTDTILTRGISIGAGLAFLLMLYGAFTFITSAGNPEKTKLGGDILTSAIIGLLFIIFSVFLLKVIGVDILNLPGFNAPRDQNQPVQPQYQIQTGGYRIE